MDRLVNVAKDESELMLEIRLLLKYYFKKVY